MGHLTIITRRQTRPAPAADADDVAKFLHETFGLAGDLVSIVAGVVAIQEQKAGSTQT